MDATINARISAPLKERGDAVLRENGLGASAAIRALWQELANTRSLPAFLQKESERNSVRALKKRALDELAGVAEGKLSNLSDEELRAVGMARYE